jgi:hypothetical protein
MMASALCPEKKYASDSLAIWHALRTNALSE